MIYRRAELKELIDFHNQQNQHGGDLNIDAVTIMRGALDLQEKRVRDSMTSIGNVFMLPQDAKLDRDTIGKIVRSGHSRIPIYSEVFDTSDEGYSEKRVRTRVKGCLLAKNLLLVAPTTRRPCSASPSTTYPPSRTICRSLTSSTSSRRVARTWRSSCRHRPRPPRRRRAGGAAVPHRVPPSCTSSRCVSGQSSRWPTWTPSASSRWRTCSRSSSRSQSGTRLTRQTSDRGRVSPSRSRARASRSSSPPQGDGRHRDRGRRRRPSSSTSCRPMRAGRPRACRATHACPARPHSVSTTNTWPSSVDRRCHGHRPRLTFSCARRRPSDRHVRPRRHDSSLSRTAAVSRRPLDVLDQSHSTRPVVGIPTMQTSYEPCAIVYVSILPSGRAARSLSSTCLDPCQATRDSSPRCSGVALSFLWRMLVT